MDDSLNVEDSEIDVFLIPLEDGRILARPVDNSQLEVADGGSAWGAWFSKSGPLVAALFGDMEGGRGKNVALFEMSSESLEKFREAKLDEIGTYFRGVLRNEKGHASHQVQLKEVQIAQQIPTSMNLVMAAQLAAIQVQLDRIEHRIEEVNENVARILQFLERGQHSNIVVMFSTLKRVSSRVEAEGSISQVDWERIVGFGEKLEALLYSVSGEINSKVEDLKFDGTPQGHRDALKKLDVERIATLAGEHQLIVTSLAMWIELMLLRTYQNGELVNSDIEEAKKDIEVLEDKELKFHKSLSWIFSESAEITPRVWFKMLFETGGIVLGRRCDEQALQELKGYQEILEMSITAKPENGIGRAHV